jgi:hypothetical protein
MDGEGKIGTVKLAESAACTGISIYYDRQPVFALAKNFGWTKGNADAAPLAPVSKYLLNKKFFPPSSASSFFPSNRQGNSPVLAKEDLVFFFRA